MTGHNGTGAGTTKSRPLVEPERGEARAEAAGAHARGVAIETAGITFSYGNGTVLHGIDLRVDPGEMVAVLGPNGSGKTTLLRILCGSLRPRTGQTRVGGVAVHSMKRTEVARTIAVLPQEVSVPYAFKVRQIVRLGRTPYLKPFSAENEHDCAVAEEAMRQTLTLPLADKVFNELSGGERQRVLLAMALAQEPKVLLLDEPTVHLDIAYQAEVLDLVRSLNKLANMTVVAVMHDLNLSAIYFDRMVLMRGGRVLHDGTPAQVLTPSTVREVYGTAVEVISHPGADLPHGIVVPRRQR